MPLPDRPLTSFRVRLTAWFGLSLLALAIGLGIAVHVLTARVMLDRVDAMLDFEFKEAAERFGSSAPTTADHHGSVPSAFHEAYVLRLTDGHDRTIVESPSLAGRSLGPASPSSPSNRFDSVDLPDLGPLRVVTGRVDGSSPPSRLQIATSLSPYLHSLRDLDAILWTILPAGVLITCLLGYVIALQAIAPVERMIQAAQRISATNLHERLDVAHPNDELGRLAWTLNAMLDRLDAAFAAIRRFTSDASHEIKTPLATIRAEAEVALLRPRDPAAYQAVLRSVVEESDRLARLTDRLLTLARDDANLKLVTHPLDIAEILTRAVRRAGDPRIQIKLPSDDPRPLIVDADPELLLQVVGNLLDNALTHAPGADSIAVTACREAGRIVVTVCDTGPGIPPESMPHVFERFYRVDPSRNRDTGGTGLGLSLVKAVVERLGGEVTLESQPGQGTSIQFALPAS
jgi:heavy metal sensor kinase